ncbi:MAG: Stp1/IreP family PP2C-type Ser/Thr phosphatase [Tissierellia bacterium]|nr:Stp1/IreP family PP2C-type Ser/Thr phosphatase [Tissierellia bacterium]
MKWIGLTDVGKVRKNNEDAYFIPERDEPFFLLADGMGGHLAGEMASSLAISLISEELRNISKNRIKTNIYNAIEKANNVIYQESLSNPDYHGMGTTLSLLYVGKGKIYYSNIGDSRIYLFKDNNLIQLTRDDSFVNYLLDVGEITEEEAKNHPRKNVLTKALGTSEIFDVKVHEKVSEKGEKFLICSDGLTSMVSFERIREIIKDYSIEEAANLLLKEALDKGGCDNITLLLITLE